MENEFCEAIKDFKPENATSKRLCDGRGHYCILGWALHKRGVSDKELMRNRNYYVTAVSRIFGISQKTAKRIGQQYDLRFSFFSSDIEKLKADACEMAKGK